MNAIQRGGFNSLAPLQRFAGYGLAGVWCSWLVVSLNGTDVSAAGDRSGNGRDEVQASPASQPLYTGAPTYGGRPSVAFTAATSDALSCSNANLSNADVTVVSIQRIRVAGTSFIASNSNTLSNGIAIGTISTRAANALGQTSHLGSLPSTTKPEMWIAMFPAASSVPTLLVNNAADALSGAATVKVATTATSTVRIGDAGGSFPIDMDWLATAWFTSILPRDIASRVARGGGALCGIAIA